MVPGRERGGLRRESVGLHRVASLADAAARPGLRDAVRKTLRSASGNTTVPMSRPSTTTSRPARTMARSRELIHSRMTGTADTADTRAGHRDAPQLRVHRHALEVGREARPVRLEHQPPVFGRAEDRLRHPATASGSLVGLAAAGRLPQRHQRDPAVERRPNRGARTPAPRPPPAPCSTCLRPTARRSR